MIVINITKTSCEHGGGGRGRQSKYLFSLYSSTKKEDQNRRKEGTTENIMLKTKICYLRNCSSKLNILRGLRRISGPKREVVTVGRRKLRNDELRTVHTSPDDIIKVIKSRRMKCSTHGREVRIKSRSESLKETTTRKT
jgi:hypothetical protein